MDSTYMETSYIKKFARTNWLFLRKENRDLEIRNLKTVRKDVRKVLFLHLGTEKVVPFQMSMGHMTTFPNVDRSRDIWTPMVLAGI